MPRFKRYDYGAMAERAADHMETLQPAEVAVDTETSGFGFYDAAFCATMSWRDASGGIYSCYLDLDDDDHGHRLACLQEMLRIPRKLIFHNAKFDLQKLILADALPDAEYGADIEDTATLHALLDENDRHGLKYLAQKILGENTNEEAVLAKVRRKLKIKKDEGYHLLPREVVVPYAMKDTEFTLRLYEKLRPQLPEDLEALYRQEIEVSLALLEVESHGIGLDLDYLRDITSKYGVKEMKLAERLRKLGHDPENPEKVFNPNSPQQITAAFERRGITIAATDKATLGKLDDDLAATLLDYRHIKKMHSTYMVGMLKEQQNGIIHPNFNTTLPRTGRMSSSAASNN